MGWPFGLSGPFNGLHEIDKATGKAILEYTPNPKQHLAHNCGADEILYGGALYGGKASDVNAMVVTPFGEKRMGDIAVGDQVTNPDGSVATVLQVHPQGIKPVFRVTCVDGASTVVTGDHLWLARRAQHRIKATRRYMDGTPVHGKLYTTLQLKEILDDLDVGYGVGGPLIPTTQPVQFTVTHRNWGTAVPIDPYLLGVLLGDGCLRGQTVTFCSADEEIVAAVRGLGFNLGEYSKDSAATNYGIKDGGVLRRLLEMLGLWGMTSADKFIPPSYKLSPLAVRWPLIQGLMDTDGTVGKNGNCSYCTVSKQLAQDLQWVLRSLGFKATITTKTPWFTHNGERRSGQLAHTLYIQGRSRKELFRLPRKRVICRKDSNRAESRRIVSIGPAGEAECRCITVDNPNGLYVCDDFIVTHNSYFLLFHNAAHCLTWGRDAKTVMFRRTFPELERSMVLDQVNLFDGKLGEYKVADHLFKWANGAKTWFGHLQDWDDVKKHDSAQYTLIAFDELTHFEERQYLYMFRRLRSPNNPNIHPQMLAATNPKGPGHLWTWNRFLKDREPSVIYSETVPERRLGGVTLPATTVTRIFIKAVATDNVAGLKNDPHYLSIMQASMTKDEYKSNVEGDWTVFLGRGFPEWDSRVHMVDDFRIPGDWKVVRALDWGYQTPFSVGWYAQDPETTAIYRILEWYGATRGSAGAVKGLQMSPALVHDGIVDRERAGVDAEAFPRVWRGSADPAIWRNDGTGCVADLLNASPKLFQPANRDRLLRKTLFHSLLRIDPNTGKPGFMVFRSCKAFTEIFPRLLLDEKNPEDIDTKQEDHLYDECGYGLIDIVRGPARIPSSLDRRYLTARMPRPV